MKVSPSLPPPHINCHRTPGGIKRVLSNLVWSKVRYGGFLVAFLWNCFGFVRDRLASFGLAASDLFSAVFSRW